jgi:hypothetical protein
MRGWEGNLRPCVVWVKPWRHSGIFTWDPFSWTLRTLEVWVWVQSGTSLEEQGSHDLDLARGHKGPVKAYMHRDRKGSTHTYSFILSFCPEHSAVTSSSTLVTLYQMTFHHITFRKTVFLPTVKSVQPQSVRQAFFCISVKGAIEQIKRFKMKMFKLGQSAKFCSHFGFKTILNIRKVW